MIILDLDNTIADDEWRIPYIRQDLPLDDQERYFDYHALAPFDWLRNEHLLLGRGGAVAIFTARPERFRVATEEWLCRNNAQYKHLFMRQNDDHRGSVALKRFFLEALTHVRHGSERLDDIICAYDDRQDVIDMYRAAGVKAERVFIHETPYHQKGETK